MAKIMDLLADVPSMLIVAWTAWFIVGGMLAMWYRRASLEAEFAPVAPAPRAAVSRPRPASRPVSEDPPVAERAPVLDEPSVAAREKRGNKPLVVGDPFGDLSTLLDQPSAAAPPAPAPSHRAPADSPILNSAGSPIQRLND
jgi:hypothetical protein